MDEKERIEDLDQKPAEAEVTEFDDKDLEDVSGGGNTNCICFGTSDV